MRGVLRTVRAWFASADAWLLVIAASLWAAGAHGSEDLLRTYKGRDKLPPGLYANYQKLVAAMERADSEAVTSLCLPHAVAITVEPRPEASREYGTDINIPFVKRGFQKQIVSIRRDSADAYLIRTATSYVFFVRTLEAGWRVYRYGDKPIE